MDENTRGLVAAELTTAYFVVFREVALGPSENQPPPTERIFEIYQMFKRRLDGQEPEKKPGKLHGF
jgi:hypothetical protein